MLVSRYLWSRRFPKLLHERSECSNFGKRRDHKYLLQQSSVSVLPFAVTTSAISRSICIPVFKIASNSRKNLVIHVQQNSKRILASVRAILVKFARHECFSKDKLQDQKYKAKQGNMDMKSFFMKHILSQFTTRGFVLLFGEHYAWG